MAKDDLAIDGPPDMATVSGAFLDLSPQVVARRSLESLRQVLNPTCCECGQDEPVDYDDVLPTTQEVLDAIGQLEPGPTQDQAREELQCILTTAGYAPPPEEPPQLSTPQVIQGDPALATENRALSDWVDQLLAGAANAMNSLDQIGVSVPLSEAHRPLIEAALRALRKALEGE